MRSPLASLLTAVLVAFGAAVAAQSAAGPPAQAAAAGPRSAGAVVATPRFVPAAGPVFAGPGGLAWVSRRDDAVLDLWVAEPGLGPRRVQRFSGADGERLRRPRLSASAGEVALRFSETRSADAASPRSYRGVFGQPLRAVADGELPPGAAIEPQGRTLRVTRRCASAEIRVLTLATPAAGERRCPLRLRSPARLRAGRLRLGLSCAGFAIDCAARVTVRIGDRVIARGRARYNHATPPFAAAGLAVGRRGLRLVRSRPRTRLRITARIGSARAIAAGRTAGTVTRSTTQTIVRSGVRRGDL